MILKKNNGVTLIELMIVLVIAAVLVAGIYALFTAQQRSYFVQDRVTGIQQDARAALDIMARDIRIAAFRTGPGSSTGFNSISINGTINYAVVPGNGIGANASDQITLVLAGDVVSRVTAVADTVVTLENNAGAFSPNDYVAFEGLNEVYQIIDQASGVDTTNNQLTLTTNAPEHASAFGGGVSGMGARIYPIGLITYNISNNSLVKNGQPLAGDGATTIVEDLQFAYQIEDDVNWYNGSFPAGKSAADIRLIRVTIIVRTAVPDPEETGFFKPACEDRGQENTFTGCRRRVYSTIVKVRNL